MDSEDLHLNTAQNTMIASIFILPSSSPSPKAILHSVQFPFTPLQEVEIPFTQVKGPNSYIRNPKVLYNLPLPTHLPAQ